MTLLHANAVAITLGTKRVLEHIDLSIAAGETVALLGANGAGKSTLLRILARLIPPARGQVLLNEQSLALVPRRELAATVGYLAQMPQAHWPLPLEELVALGRLPHGGWQGLTGRSLDESDAEAVARALDDCDVAHLATHPVNTLSGGERARGLLARVLAGAPKLLLADEPVAGLDPSHQIQVMQLLADYARQRNAGVLVVMHDLHLAARYCQRLVLLHEGRVLADGNWREVLAPERVAQALGVSLFVGADGSAPVVAPLATLPPSQH